MSITIKRANELIDAFCASVIDIDETVDRHTTMFKPHHRYTATNGNVSHLELAVEYNDPSIAHGYTKKVVDFEEDQLELPPQMFAHIAQHLVLALLKLKSKI